MPELVFYRRGGEVLRVGITRQRQVLGSGDTCDIIIPDPHVSPQQVALLYDGTRCMLEDLSGQGTRVSGKPMTHGELPDGGGLELGAWRAVFRLRSAAGAGSPRTGASTDVKASDTLEEALPPVRLCVKQGGTQYVHELGDAPFTVGKDPANAVVIQERFISNRHLQVTRRGAGWHVRDLNSTNGTYQGGTRLYDAEVPLHTVLRIGETELVFEPVPQGSGEPDFHGLIGREPAVRQLVELIRQVAPSSVAVTVLGESGTGKELVARALHECSPRAGKPFLPLNCAALSPGLVESELFGHEKGAFTGADSRRQGAFEGANGGTLFLDEVGELPLELQAKLLRVLESGEVKPVGATRPFHVDVRVVAATNRELSAFVLQGKFREDLYYRLCGIPLVLPPLRNRSGDIRLLAEHFVRMSAPQELELEVRFTAAALARLQQHTWPGNVRELRSVVCLALLRRKGLTIDASDLSFEQAIHRGAKDAAVSGLQLPAGVTLEQMMQRVERQLIEDTLRRCNNHKDRTAKQLGLARSALFKRLKEWGLGQGEE